MSPKKNTTPPQDRAGAETTEEEKKTTTTKKKDHLTMEERYDYSRTQVIELAVLPPCKGLHETADFYKGSPSGCNKWGHWTGCEKCKQRMTYTPSFGAHGIYRKAGPLPADLEATTNRLGKKASYSEELKPTSVALEGAERSLEARLEVIRAQRARASGSAAASAAAREKETPTTKGTTTKKPQAKEQVMRPQPMAVDLTQDDSEEENDAGWQKEPEVP